MYVQYRVQSVAEEGVLYCTVSPSQQQAGQAVAATQEGIVTQSVSHVRARRAPGLERAVR